MLKQEKEQLIRQEKDTCLELSKYEDELSEIERDMQRKKRLWQGTRKRTKKSSR